MGGLDGERRTRYQVVVPRRDRRLLRFAREMRSDPTPAEEILWRELRRREMEVRFRRQELVDRFIVDFACRPLRLMVEVDGDSHVSAVRDAARDRRLAELGWTVLRFDDHDVYTNLAGVLEMIWDWVHERLPPLPRGRSASPPAAPGES